MSRRDFDAVVIGAGLNGLTAAAYLAEAGHRTLVLERRGIPGGVLATEEFAPGFQCDTGLHDVGWIPPELAADLDLGRQGLEFLQPDPPLSVLLPKGGALHLWRNRERTVESLRKHSPPDAERWSGFVEEMGRHAGVLAALYASPPPRLPRPGLGDLPPLARFGLRLRGLGRDGMTEFLRIFPMSASEILDGWFQHDALKGALGASGCLGVFQGPRSAGTGFVMLHHHVGSEEGVFRARGLIRGGAGRLAETLAEVAAARGAKIRYDAEVSAVTVRDGKAVGVALEDGEEIGARVVVSGADPRRTFLSLVGATKLPPEFVRKVDHLRCRGAWAKVHLALSDLPRFEGVDPSALAGVISLTPSLEDLERAYDDAKYGRVSERPQLEMRIPTLADPSLAPVGRHVLSIRAQYVPYHLSDGEWDGDRREALGDRVVSALSRYAPNLPDVILHRQVLTPVDLESRFALTEGSASHGEMALDQLLFMRPVAGWARYRTPIEGLFLCGRGAHPGPGIVGGAGRLAVREVLAGLEG